MDDWFLIVLICLSGLRIGGKDSTDYVVKGTHKKLSQELIDELTTICQVFFWLIELLCIGFNLYICVCFESGMGYGQCVCLGFFHEESITLLVSRRTI